MEKSSSGYSVGKFDIITIMVAFAVLVSGVTFGFFKQPQIATAVMLVAVAVGVTLFVWEKFYPAAEGTLRYKLNSWLRLPGIVGITALASGFLTACLFVNPIIWCIAAAYAFISVGLTLVINRAAAPISEPVIDGAPTPDAPAASA